MSFPSETRLCDGKGVHESTARLSFLGETQGRLRSISGSRIGLLYEAGDQRGALLCPRLSIRLSVQSVSPPTAAHAPCSVL